ncbi:hypothetical protein B8W99_04060 [Peribacillus simplex]|nr:hypothetical protein B8W99_04060 [Peribacillus simplex]
MKFMKIFPHHSFGLNLGWNKEKQLNESGYNVIFSFNIHISLCTVSALNYGEVVITNLLNGLEKRNEGIYLRTVMN